MSNHGLTTMVMEGGRPPASKMSAVEVLEGWAARAAAHDLFNDLEELEGRIGDLFAREGTEPAVLEILSTGISGTPLEALVQRIYTNLSRLGVAE